MSKNIHFYSIEMYTSFANRFMDNKYVLPQRDVSGNKLYYSKRT